MNTKDSKIQWHPAFDAALQIELGDEAKYLTFEPEHLLSKKPMQIDVLVKNEKNLGMTGNWNKCLAEARGDYIKLICADDVLYKDSIEKELFEELETTFQAHAAGTLEEEAFPFIEDVFSILEDNRDIVSALLGPHGDIGFLTKIESILSKYSFKVLKKSFPERDADLACAYSFCLTGCVGVIKAWLSGRLGDKTPDYRAALIYRMITSVLHSAMDEPEK